MTTAPELKRYIPELDWDHGDCFATMTENPHGEYVRFTDATAALNAMRAERNAALARVAGLCDTLKTIAHLSENDRIAGMARAALAKEGGE